MAGKASKDARAGVRAENAGGKLRQEAEPQAPAASYAPMKRAEPDDLDLDELLGGL